LIAGRGRALALADDLLIHDLTVSSDCKQVVDDIWSGDQGHNGSIITEINLRALNLNCNFLFEGRAVNGEAHSLAKHSLTLSPGRHMWLANPHDPNVIPIHVAFD
jgi:hypothetical protein